jgi:uncharacterized protein YcbX
MAQITLTGLYIYPIKSAAGIAVDTAKVHPRGLNYDRRWMVVDAQGQFITQRQFPKMALIQTALTESHLVISAEGRGQVAVPFVMDGEVIPVQVWKDTCGAIATGTETQAWLSDFLEMPCQLVYMPDESDRPVRHPDTQHQVSFADAFPVLLISEASLTDLNERLADPVPMNRFRPNLVVTGCEAFAEDTWKEIQVGTVTFSVAKPCSRCVVTTVEQTTGIRDKEPLKTLGTYRLWDGQIWFGQNLLQHNLGRLHLGDRVNCLAEGE